MVTFITLILLQAHLPIIQDSEVKDYSLLSFEKYLQNEQILEISLKIV